MYIYMTWSSGHLSLSLSTEKEGKYSTGANIHCMPPGVRVHHFTSVYYILPHRHTPARRLRDLNLPFWGT